MLRQVHRGYPGSSAENVFAVNAAVFRVLEKRVSFPFPEDTPLEDVLKHLKQSTRGPDGKSINIYVDPIGLQESDKTMTSTVRNIDLENVPVRVGLRACLQQLDLAYFIRDGILIISSAESEERFPHWSIDYSGPYAVVSQCLLALLAAGFGALAAGKMWSSRGTAHATPSRPAAVTGSR